MNYKGTKNPFLVAIEMLNTKNARDCWMLNSFLSSFERFDNSIGVHNLVFPMLNLAKIDMYSKAIVLSKAMDYKKDIISDNEFGDIMNLLIDTTDFESNDEIKLLNKENLFEKFFIPTVISQIRFQHTNFRDRMARAYALLQYYPENGKIFLKQKLSKNYIDIPNVLASVYVKHQIMVLQLQHIHMEKEHLSEPDRMVLFNGENTILTLYYKIHMISLQNRMVGTLW